MNLSQILTLHGKAFTEVSSQCARVKGNALIVGSGQLLEEEVTLDGNGSVSVVTIDSETGTVIWDEIYQSIYNWLGY